MNSPINRFVTVAALAASIAMPTLSFAQSGGMSGEMSGDATSTAVIKSGTPVSKGDQMFFTKAAIGGMTEVEAGKLALAQGSSADVKAFGQRMVDDHGKAGMQLESLAGKKNVTLPSAPDAKHQAMLDGLKAKQGKAFDTAFIADMKKGHADAIAAFTKASHSKDTDIAQFASSTLPTLKDHQKTIPKT